MNWETVDRAVVMDVLTGEIQRLQDGVVVTLEKAQQHVARTIGWQDRFIVVPLPGCMRLVKS